MLAAALLFGCGPDKQKCTLPEPSFQVVFSLQDKPLSPDTVIDVQYGGTGTDQYDLAAPDAHTKVIFCRSTNRDCSPRDVTLGAAGASDEPGDVVALCCDLWTGGVTQLDVHATGLAATHYVLYPREGECSGHYSKILDSPDAG